MQTWVILLLWIERLVLVLLLILSVWSIAIIFDRKKIFKSLEDKDGDIDEAKSLIEKKDWEKLSKWTQTYEGLRSGTVQAMLEVCSDQKIVPEKIDRSVMSFLQTQRSSLDKGFNTLATLGSNAPFIGLFGTVLGIIEAFAVLAGSSSQSTAADSVMASISQALVATAAGLFVAIPAVIAFNLFSKKLKNLISECESLRDYFIAKTL